MFRKLHLNIYVIHITVGITSLQFGQKSYVFILDAGEI